MDEIDITGIDHGALLAALYNNARPLGLGFFRARYEPMTAEEANEIITGGDDHQRDFNRPKGSFGNWSVDYVHGRPIKVSVIGNALHNARLYDRDHGEGACARIVTGLRATVVDDEATTP